MASVHSVAEAGFGKGTNELYDRARPSYQAPAIEHIRKAIPSTGALNIAEVGAGTGIFTRALLAHPSFSSGAIAEVKAAEPSAGMREVFADTIKDEKVGVSDGTFVKTGVEDGWADVVIVAQAFHWCHPNYAAAATEFARILKPKGVVALIWNLEDRDRAQWVAQLRNTIEVHEQGAPQYRLGLWRAAFDTPEYKSLFSPPEEKSWEYVLPGTEEIAVDRACSKSYISVLQGEEKAKVVQGVRDSIKKGEDMKWIDEGKGVFEYPYNCLVVLWKKKE